jgi:peptidoglycan/LPS O-acetylase OafA/YrhL
MARGSAQDAKAGSRIPGLDLLRGIAALGVVGYHLAYAITFLDPRFPTFDFGARGVQVFFAISGYVILYSAHRAANRRAFALARWVRLYPAFVICMCLTTGWVRFWGIDAYTLSPRDWIANLTMLPGLFGATAADGPYWSLAYEIAFYAIVGALLPWIKRGYSLHLCALYLAAAPIFPGEVYSVTCFPIGIALYELDRNVRSLRSAHGMAALTVLFGAIIIGHHTDASLVAPLAVAIAMRVPVPTALASWAGRVSYPLYLLHNHVGCTLVFVYAVVSPFGTMSAVVLAACSVILIAASVNQFLERPLIAALRQFTGQRKHRRRPDTSFQQNTLENRA